jgi:hypothetical protein
MWQEAILYEERRYNMPGIETAPIKRFLLSQDGIENALDAVVSDPDQAKNIASLLNTDPRILIRRVFHMNAFQRAALDEMEDDELTKIIEPIAKALIKRDANDLRVKLWREEVTHSSPLSCKCHIEIDTK